MAKELFFYVGTYMPETMDALFAMRVEEENGKLELVEAYKGIANPSSLVVSWDKRNLYAVSESRYQGTVHAYALQKHRARYQNSAPTEAAVTCCLAVDERKEYLVAASGLQGGISVFRLGQRGELGKRTCRIIPKGETEESSRIHAVLFARDMCHLYALDLGRDRVLNYDFDRETGKLSRKGELKLPPGAGPGRMVLHPKLKDTAYVLCERSSTVCLVNKEQGVLQCLSSLPQKRQGEGGAMSIKLGAGGRHAYVVNTRHNSIAILELDPETGRMQYVATQKTAGQNPKDFALLGKVAVVACQESNQLESYFVNHKSGRLTPTGQRFSIDIPVCIALPG